MEKTCSKCAARLPYSAFHPKATGADGLTAYCRSCSNAMCAEYRKRKATDIAVQRAVFREKNRSELAQKSREWARRNPEKVKQNCQNFYSKNRDKRREYNRAWVQAHQDEMRVYYAEKTRRRFAAVRRAVPLWADRDKILLIYQDCQRVSQETGIMHHVDHVIPLVSPLVCGLHVETNLQILTASDNLSKSNRFDGGS